MQVQEIQYYEPETHWTDRVRSVAQDLALSAMRRLDHLARWDCLDNLRWWLEGHLHELFGIWWEKSPEQVMSAVHGELPLDCINDWQKSHILDFELLSWYCMDCHEVCQTWEADEDLCPHCFGSLHHADQGMADYTAILRGRRALAETAPKPALLMLTERRAA